VFYIIPIYNTNWQRGDVLPINTSGRERGREFPSGGEYPFAWHGIGVAGSVRYYERDRRATHRNG